MSSKIFRDAFAVLMVLALLGQWSQGQSNPNVEGTVRDARTNDPLPGANVILVGTSLGASTDINGRYVVRNVPPGSYTIRATYVGYKTISLPLQVAEAASEVRQEFKLEAVALEGETVYVTAQASGQNEAINQQLASNQIVNVVSSARIQELPDANAAESIGRLPGVSILRSGGEGTQVVIRGLQPKYNSITVDGVKMASSNASDRSTDLSMISPEMLDGIEVRKTVLPDQDADVLGGTVNFKMRETKGERGGIGVSLLAQGGYNGLSNAYNKYNNYKIVGSADGRFLDDQLGIFAQADLERRNLSSNEFGGSYNHLGDSHTEYITLGLNLNNIPRDRQRANGTLVMDYRLPDGNIKFTNFLSSGSTNIQNRGEFYNTTAANLHNYTFAYSSSTLNLITNALNVQYQLPVFLANVSLSHTYSETKNPNDWTVGFQQSSAGLGAFVDKPNLIPQTIPRAANNDTNNTFLGSLLTYDSFSRERALTAALDLETPINLTDQVTAIIKFGGKFRHQTRSYVYDQYTGQGLGLLSARTVDSLIATHFPSTSGYANTTSIPVMPFLDPGYDYGKFLNGDYRMILPLNYAMLSEMARYVRSQAGFLARRNDIAYFHDNFNSTARNYDGTEDQSAAYVMGTFNIGEEITVIPGVRYQNLKTTYTASRGQQNTASGTGGPYFHYDTTLTVNHGYWLPALMVKYKPLQWFDVRLSYTNTLAYPDYNAVVPLIDVTSSAITWNNYQLKPTRSKNFDAYLSFYDNDIGLFTVGGFLKQITDLIYPWTFYVSGNAALPYYPPYIVTAPPSGVYGISTYVNNPNRIDDWGVEFDWQTHFWYLPHPFDGLVLNANYTHIFSEAKYPYTLTRRVGRVLEYVDTTFTDRLLYQPNNIVNLSLGYDFEDFSIRVSMIYHDKIFTGPVFWEQLRTSTSAYTRWDISVKQRLPWFGLQVYGDLNNLNSAYDVSVINGAGVVVPQSQQSYGLTADIGIRWQLQ